MFTITIWTEAYRPFIMGGDVNAPIKTAVEASGPVDAGKGIRVFVVSSPDGTTHIAESTTGALVGVSLEQVKDDIAAADEAVIAGQLMEAKNRVKVASYVTPKEFWSMMK